MKKLFFFRSSSGNGTDKQVQSQKSADSKMKTQASSQAEQEFNSPKSQGEVSGGPALRRSLSLSSAGFPFYKFGESSTNDLTCATKSQGRQRKHSSRCVTPERQVRERHCEADKFQHDPSGSMSSCSSKVLDLYIDGEEHLEHCKQKSISSHSNVSGRSSQRRLPPRFHCTAPTSPSDNVNETRKSHSFREAKGTRLRFSSTDCVENGSRHGSTRSLARDVIERLSQSHGKPKGSDHEPITIQDVYGGTRDRNFDSNSVVAANALQAEHYEPVNEYHAHGYVEHQQDYVNGEYMYRCIEKDIDSELEMKIEEAEKRLKLFSQELEQQRCLSDCDFDVSSLVGAIRKLEDERVNLAFDNVSLLRSQMVDRTSAREEIRRVKSDWGLHIQRLEKEKRELQAGLEKELDRRSGEWTSKLENFHLEERKLRERVRELAEQNVSLQRELSSLHENETENKDMLTHLERRVAEMTTTVDNLHDENSYLKQTLTELQESYAGATEDLDFLRRNFDEKDQECRELHKSVTKLLRTCKEQGKTIEGLRDGVSEEIKNRPSEKSDQSFKKLQMEQLRLTGIELSLRKEVESMKLETDSLRQENIRLLNRLKGNGEEIDITTLKLENELKMRVSYLQDQGLSMLNESNQLCYKLLKLIKGKLTVDTDSRIDGLSEQFMVESEMKVQGIRRGTENLKRSLQTVTSVVVLNSQSSCSSTGRPKDQRNRSIDETLRAELKAETLITSLLREKLYSKEEEIEELQAEVAAAVRGNEILRCEVQSNLDNLSVKTHELKDLKLQMLKKEENINQLEINLKEAAKDMASMKTVLPKVTDERERIWREYRQCCEKNKLLSSENEKLKGMTEKLEQRLLEKEGEISILQDTIKSKHLNIFSSPDFLV